MSVTSNKTLYIISGVPGSGKSTLASAMREAGLVDHHFEADNFFIGTDGVYRYNPDFIYEAHRQCQALTRAAMADGQNVVVSNTFTKDIFLRDYIDMAREFGYNIIEMVMKSNGYDSIHRVPPATVSKMRLQLQERLTADWALR